MIDYEINKKGGPVQSHPKGTRVCSDALREKLRVMGRPLTLESGDTDVVLTGSKGNPS